MNGKTLEEMQRDAEAAAREAARLEAELAAAREAAEQARQEAARRRRAAELAWAERMLATHAERHRAAAEAVAAAEDAFAKAVLTSPLGKAFLALAEARLELHGLEVDYFEAMDIRGTPSTSRAAEQPAINYDREMRNVLNQAAMALLDEAEKARRAARERAILAGEATA